VIEQILMVDRPPGSRPSREPRDLSKGAAEPSGKTWLKLRENSSKELALGYAKLASICKRKDDFRNQPRSYLASGSIGASLHSYPAHMKLGLMFQGAGRRN
jgi:hypothetical protein